MAYLDIKELFDAYNNKVAEKLKALDTKIGNIDAGGGGGVSNDAGNSLVLGTDSLPYYSELTGEEIATLYEALVDTNKFTDAYKSTLDNLDISTKADLDPETGYVVADQLPPSSGDITYVHDQGTASATWSITHNLGKYPAVTVIDSAGTEFEVSVTHHDLNSLTIELDSQFSGKAVLN